MKTVASIGKNLWNLIPGTNTKREKECVALIKVMELRNKLTDIEMQSVYFRGCYDSVGYLKKAGIL